MVLSSKGPFVRAMPDAVVVKLRFNILAQMINIGATISSRRWSSNAFDVDPLLLSTAMAGFAEWAAFYEQFRVTDFTSRVTISNNETFPVLVLHGYSKDDVGLNGLSLNFSGNPFFVEKMISAKGGMDRHTFVTQRSLVEIAGTKEVLTDDRYAGFTSGAAPSRLCFMNLGTVSAGFPAVDGQFIGGSLDLTVQFYRKMILAI